MKTISLITSALLFPICSALLATAFDASMLWISLGVLLALPSLWSLLKPQQTAWTFYANIASLFLVSLIASADLWSALLAQENIDSGPHFLALSLVLLLAIAQQLLHLNLPKQPTLINEWIAEGLKGAHILVSLSIALILNDLLLIYLSNVSAGLMDTIAIKVLSRGIIPPITITLFIWGGVLLASKWLIMQQEILRFKNNTSAFHQAKRLAKQSQQADDFVMNTIWQQFEAFYNMPRYINWAIPILGFIGTVLGISLATEGLSAILNNNDSEFSQLLASALEPLGVAFDTTLIALSLSVILALLQTLLYRWEEQHLLTLEEALNNA